MIMVGQTTVKLILFLMVCDLLLISVSECKPWWSRRRRRCSSSRPSDVKWVNNWHKRFSAQCRNSCSLRKWVSQHRNCKEDRIHYFECGYGPVPYNMDNCSGFVHNVNKFDKPVKFKCNHDGFLTGVRSTFSRRHRDRRFSFRCCRVKGFFAHTCKTTSFQNKWDADLSYVVPNGYYLVGVYSKHSNHHEDRRWKFEICKFSKKSYK